MYHVGIDETIFDLMERYVGLTMHEVDNRQAVQAALDRLLHLALAALQKRE
jgi:hypothetical protein